VTDAKYACQENKTEDSQEDNEFGCDFPSLSLKLPERSGKGGIIEIF